MLKVSGDIENVRTSPAFITICKQLSLWDYKNSDDKEWKYILILIIKSEPNTIQYASETLLLV